MASKRQTITGTIKQFQAQGYTVNGRELNGVEFNTLCNIFGTAVDKAKIPGQKGKPATVWEMPVNLLGKLVIAEAGSNTAENV